MSDHRALKQNTLAFRHLLEGYQDDGTWVPGDLELVLRGYGIFRDRDWLDPNRLSHLGDEGLALRHRLKEAIEALPESAQQKSSSEDLQGATALYIREAAYTWFNRLVALRCLEARVPGVDEAIKVKPDYAGRSLRHDRFCRQYPELCQGEDGGLAAFLREVCAEAAQELPLLFDPDSPLTLVTPSPDALQKCVRVLSGEKVSLTRSASDIADGLSDDAFCEPDLLGWIYQYWNTEEKDRVFEAAARGKKIEGPDIIPATCIYTEDYMVRFLVENSLGVLWVEIHPDSRLPEQWPYFVRNAERRPHEPRPVTDLTFLDPACGSGHFLVYAFDLLWDMYQEEGRITDPAEICRSILERNLYGIDIDERSVQIAAISLYLKAKERAPHFTPQRVNLVAANASVPPDAVQRYLQAHPEDRPLHGVLESIFEGLENVSEVGSLLQVEEQLDRALQDLRKQEACRAKDGPEQISMLPLLGLRVPPIQGQLSLDMLPPWEDWKPAVLDRLHRQFQQEADAKDLSTAIFGTQAAKGLGLIELLSSRYDVVTANPPYMGSKNMGLLLKTYVQRHYPQGKRDLYAAFIQRCLQLAEPGGKVAMVTQQSWMFLGSFAELRKGVLQQQTIECLAHLGEHGFEELAAAGAFVALFVLTQAPPAPEQRLWAARLIGPESAGEKATALERAAQGNELAVVSQPLQARFLSIPYATLSYWLRDRFFELLVGRALGDVADVVQGLATANDPRFVRFTWEAPPKTWATPVRSRRWVPFEKGGGYAKWFGHHFWVVDWENNGIRMKLVTIERYGNAGKRIYNEGYFFQSGYTYSSLARGSVGLRYLTDSLWGAVLADAVMPRTTTPTGLGAVLNTRLTSAAVRWFRPQIVLSASYVARVPVPEHIPSMVITLESACIDLKRWLVARNPVEQTFAIRLASGTFSLAETYRLATEQVAVVAATLHALEGISEKEVFNAYSIIGDDLATVLDETGMPAGWYPILEGHDAIPPLPDGLPLPTLVLELLARERRQVVSSDELAALKARLRVLYEVGWSERPEAGETEDTQGTEDEEKDETSALGAHIPIPTETVVEAFSQKLKIHPISIYWLLKELREQEGVVSLSELHSYVEDYFTVVLLRLLGYHWPRQIEAGEPVPEWADPDGIIPLIDGTGQRMLLDRVRERIATDFGEARVDAIEQEFHQIMDRSLIDWLARDFFPHHVSQFKRRPIAWLLESGRAVDTRWETTRSHRGRRPARSRGSAFACLVYYHKLTADSLTRIKTHYLRPVLQRREFELAEERRRAAEGNTAARASAERLAEVVDELTAFEAALDTVSTQGFSSRHLVDLLNKDEPDSWMRRTPQSPIPDKEAFIRQEQAYDPDLNDGVRVNIAPLQKYGLLATDVLAKKDVDRAIEDRAAWRADERRWCREGKLPKPGWWQDRD
jgi:N-6 DNA Methylase